MERFGGSRKGRCQAFPCHLDDHHACTVTTYRLDKVGKVDPMFGGNNALLKWDPTLGSDPDLLQDMLLGAPRPPGKLHVRAPSTHLQAFPQPEHAPFDDDAWIQHDVQQHEPLRTISLMTISWSQNKSNHVGAHFILLSKTCVCRDVWRPGSIFAHNVGGISAWCAARWGHYRFVVYTV